MFRASPLPNSQQHSSQPVKQEPILPTMRRASTDNQYFPIDLIRFSIEAEKRKPKPAQGNSLGYDLVHAAPLISLNHRDVVILDEWFAGEDMAEMGREIGHLLGCFMPAPCWEDSPFDFLVDLL